MAAISEAGSASPLPAISKTIDMAGGVNVTLGLSIIRTSPDHGTALDIAGKGLADPASLMAAIRLAGQLAEKRGLA